MVVVTVQPEAAVTAAVPVVAVVASWLLVEDKMYFLSASAVHTSGDGNRMFMFMLQGRRDGTGGRESTSSGWDACPSHAPPPQIHPPFTRIILLREEAMLS